MQKYLKISNMSDKELELRASSPNTITQTLISLFVINLSVMTMYFTNFTAGIKPIGDALLKEDNKDSTLQYLKMLGSNIAEWNNKITTYFAWLIILVIVMTIIRIYYRNLLFKEIRVREKVKQNHDNQTEQGQSV